MGRDIFSRGGEESFLDRLAPAAEEPAGSEVRVGRRIRRLREEKGLSLADLAKATGLSTALLSQIETRIISPPFSTLIKIARGLGVTMGLLISDQRAADFHLVRQGQGEVASRFASLEGVSYGYSYLALAPDLAGRHMEPFLVTLEPTETPPAPSRHEGEEFLYVLEGQVEVSLGDWTGLLDPGDSIYYHSTLPHLVRGAGNQRARIMAVVFAAA